MNIMRLGLGLEVDNPVFDQHFVPSWQHSSAKVRFLSGQIFQQMIFRSRSSESEFIVAKVVVNKTIKTYMLHTISPHNLPGIKDVHTRIFFPKKC
jgi:hypothetical protein